MLPFSFEDRYPAHKGVAAYHVTNEEPFLLHSMIKPFKNGLGIASGGEVTFFTLLPKTKGSLVLIDHSYDSLRAFCLKALILTKLGPKGTRDLFTFGKAADWKSVIDSVKEHLPICLAPPPGSSCALFGSFSHIRREWFYGGLEALKKGFDRLDRIKLIHGDLLDTADRGPYDFLYLSNALEHSCRPALTKSGSYSSHPNVPKLSELLSPGAEVLWVQANGSTYGANQTALSAWPTKKTIAGFRTTWNYLLSEKPK